MVMPDELKPEERRGFRLNPEPQYQCPWWWWSAWAVVGLAMFGLGYISAV